MKRKVTILIVAAIVLIATVAMANGGLTVPFFEDATEFEDVTESSPDSFYELDDTVEFIPDFTQELETITQITEKLPVAEIVVFSDSPENTIDTLENYIKANDFEEYDQKRIKNKFISTITDYRMTINEFEFINSLINENYDIEMLLEIYEFLRWTNSDITMIPEIYLLGEQNSDEDFWIYDTYDHILNRTDDILTVEDVAYYVGMGISVDEITGAYELSFSGVKTTKEMLNERLTGSSWNTIVAPVVSNDPQAVINTPEMSIDDIMLYMGYSVKTRRDFSDVIAIENNTVTLSEDVVSEINNTSELKRNFINKFDAEMPVMEIKEQTKDMRNNNITPVTIEPEEYIFEEDLIPVEEPEVE